MSESSLFKGDNLMAREVDLDFSEKGFEDAVVFLRRRKTHDLSSKLSMFKLDGISQESGSIYFTHIMIPMTKGSLDNKARLVADRKAAGKQLLTRIGLHPKTYQQLSKWKEWELRKQIVKVHLRHNSQKQVLVRLVKMTDKSGRWSIRAVLSNRYHVFDTVDVLPFVEDELQNDPVILLKVGAILTHTQHLFYYRLTNWFKYRDQLDYSFGLELKNSETGHGGIIFTPILLFKDEKPIILRIRLGSISLSHDDDVDSEMIRMSTQLAINQVRPLFSVESFGYWAHKEATREQILDYLGRCKVASWVMEYFREYLCSEDDDKWDLMFISRELGSLANKSSNEREAFDLRNFAGDLLDKGVKKR